MDLTLIIIVLVFTAIVLAIVVFFQIIEYGVTTLHLKHNPGKVSPVSSNPDIEKLRESLQADTFVLPDNQPAASAQPASGDSLPSPLSAYELLAEFLADNGCKPVVLDDDTPQRRRIAFIYQGSSFIASASAESGDLNLVYNDFYDADTSEADTLSRIVDHYAGILHTLKVYTTFNDEENTVQLNLALETRHAAADDIADFVSQACIIASNILEDMAKNNYQSSPEVKLNARRCKYLLYEEEFQHSEHQLSADAHNPLTVGTILTTLFDKTDAINVCRMNVLSNGKNSVFKDASLIFNYNIIPAVYDVHHKKLFHNTVIQVDTYTNNYLLQLDAFTQSDLVVYIRLNAMQTPRFANNSLSKQTSFPETISLVMAYDINPYCNIHDEFNYMWHDAQDKILDNRESALSEEQKMLVSMPFTKTSEICYHGYKLFLNKRYYEAIVTLLPVYDKLKRKYYSEDKERDPFFHVCYIIGFCYSELRQYDRAYFYLEIAQTANRYNYTMEYINALANAGDIRTFYEIDRMIDILEDKIKRNENHEPTAQQDEYYQFLLRRRGYTCIELRMLDEAENIFNKLLEFPDSENYARNELGYIQELRRQNKNTQQTNNNINISNPMNTTISNGRRIASDRITTLDKGEIFVFGSNIYGNHGGGAAYTAFNHFGAEWGKGEGLYGQSYALPTMEGYDSFRNAVSRFTDFAAQHPDLTFLVTAVGCGIAGYTVEQVAPMFSDAARLENVYLPQSFWNYISLP